MIGLHPYHRSDSRKFIGRALGLAVVSCALLVGARLAGAQVVIQTVPVGNVGNAPDSYNPYGDGNFGSVGYAYNIGKYDVTAGQYAAFLNAVAKTDTYGLYSANMGAGNPAWGCGIARSGSPGGYAYTTTKNADFPVNYVSFWDAARFTNWLQNGQPTNVGQVAGTTETGAYDLTVPGAISSNAATRTTGATWAVASEDEWYKAAYYDPNKNGTGNPGYWLYPTKSDSDPSNVLSATGTNNANYYDYYGTGNGGFTDPVNYLTPVGAFSSSPSAYGTYDEGGDVFQWNDTSIIGSCRGVRGGSFGNVHYLQSGYRDVDDPAFEHSGIGFRVVALPEPASLAVLTLGVIGMLVRRSARR